MWDLGAHGASEGIDFGDIAAAEVTTAWSAAIWYETAGSGSAYQAIFKKGDQVVNGWGLQAHVGTGWRAEAAGTAATAANTSLSTTTQYMLMAAYDGSNMDYYLNGSADGTPAFTTDATASSTHPISVGWDGVNSGGRDLCSGGFMGQPVLWNSALVSADATTYNAKSLLPDFGNIVFWARGRAKLDEAIIGSAAASENGSTGMHADAAIDDAYPQGGDDPMFWLIGCYWGPFILAAREFGANLFMQSEGEIRRAFAHTQKVIGCALPDYAMWEWKNMWDAAYRFNGRRVAYG